MRSSSSNHFSSRSLFIAIHGLLASVKANDSQAVSVPFGPDFVGYDGAWSAASIRVGSPEQYLLLFPSTTTQETWVAGPSLCDGTATCASLRGGLFYAENSTTWRDIGQYELGYSTLSQTVDNGDYGFDNISISDTVTASDQIVAIVDDIRHWNGEFGLGVQDTRFNSSTDHLAFISTLVQNNSAIGSHSYGYTAGASYQGAGVSGSLTLGGVDTGRFVSNNFWFDLSSGYIPSVALRSLEVTAFHVPEHWATSPLPLLSQNDAASFTIDSSTPYLWLPESVCDNIARALNLTWDATIELYTFDNDTTPQDLDSWSLSFTFRLANDLTSSEMIALEISYDAFNLQLSYPYPGLFEDYSDAKVNYFPLRRANSSQQYTVGRAFLQETYLTVDYERNRFSLAQALFPTSNEQSSLSVISRPDDSTWPGPGGVMPSNGLSTGAKVGIAVGMVVMAAAITGLVWVCCLRRRKRNKDSLDEKLQKTGLLSMFSKISTRKSSISASASELPADKRHPTEMVSDSSNSRFELSATAPAEMAAAEVSPTFFADRSNARIAQRNDPRSPVELTQTHESRRSISKYPTQHLRQTSSPVPAYSPTDISPGQSNSVSPYTQRYSGNSFQHSSDNGISPVTGTNSDRDRSSHLWHAQNGSGSDQMLNLISPVQPRNDGASSSHSSSQPSSTKQPVSLNGQMSRAMLSPNPEGRVPRRSPSRDSRFKEELTEDDRPVSAARQQAQPSEQATARQGEPQSRFSWEGR
ncbi:hypothetical protein OHC33_003081 [Knufia fluminis]|uniref:Peptidase A1 domain-containing protein n=1 Tax=Knufia fluminis TaxID=191047 RepID=A0AAN8EH53_9EURO|nr:hypothetical protein OHC33_003081 [Knufia fluminis]